jgi:hypothetical protein
MRWFFEGKIPNSVTKILEETGLDISENRTDHYLLVQACDNIGIKVRNSRLEIKRRRDVHPHDISELNISGNIEQWERWEWNDKTACIEIEHSIYRDDENPWIKVDKKRWQKKFSIHDKVLFPVPSQSLYSDLAMEITELKSTGKSWWTIGFDLFTEQDHSFFDRLIEIFPMLQIEVDLKKEWSYGYPRWLSQVVMHNNNQQNV